MEFQPYWVMNPILWISLLLSPIIITNININTDCLESPSPIYSSRIVERRSQLLLCRTITQQCNIWAICLSARPSYYGIYIRCDLRCPPRDSHVDLLLQDPYSLFCFYIFFINLYVSIDIWHPIYHIIFSFFSYLLIVLPIDRFISLLLHRGRW